MNSMPGFAYPHISHNDSSEPIVTGTRTTVKRIAGYYKLGMNADEICDALTHLSPAEIHAALAYYFDCRPEIEELLEQERVLFQQLKHEQSGQFEQAT
jgi:uncharacterized protein (DUF433 family)